MPDVWVPVSGSAGMSTALQVNHRLGFQRTAIAQAFLTSGSSLEIGNVSVCAGIGR